VKTLRARVGQRGHLDLEWQRRTAEPRWQAIRQPLLSSAAEKLPVSASVGGNSPASRRTRHLLQVSRLRQVESIVIPTQLAASNTLTPAGTRTVVARGWKVRV
jgi:hypothetical protein